MGNGHKGFRYDGRAWKFFRMLFREEGLKKLQKFLFKSLDGMKKSLPLPPLSLKGKAVVLEYFCVDVYSFF